MTRRFPGHTNEKEYTPDMSEAIRKQYCVGGVWKDSKTEKWMPVTDSSTGEVIAEVPSCTQDEVLEAIDAADKAFKEWSQVSVSKRTQMMFKWRNILVEHLDELTYLCAKELGKNLSEARGDVLKAIEPTELACATPFVSQGGHRAVQLPGDDPLGLDGAARDRHGQHGRAQGSLADAAHRHAYHGTLL